MKKIGGAVILLSMLIACNSSTTDNAVKTIKNNEVNKVKKDSFFPVTSFIKGQLKVIDSLPVTPLETITINKKIDSVWLKKEQLRALLNSFVEPEINETNLVSFFKETSFKDETLNAITFTYDPLKVLPNSISLRHWDVYINPESGKITKVYIVKQVKEKEGEITQQLTWTTNKWAMIVTLINKPDGKTELVKADKFIWNFNE